MEDIKNEDIFNRLFETDEKILWSGKPIVKEKPLIDEDRKCCSLA